MKSGHNNRQDQPIANATDDFFYALLHVYALALPVCTAADSPTANGGKGLMNARRSIRGWIWYSTAILTIFTAGYGAVAAGNSKNLRIRG
ncbi:MAG: hypothetical protein U9N36_10890 [Euryarchaeota archaeon]|nr:hypothetical protein [Euryarchaeota archaeon]